jgi:hypothetical protein
VRFRKWNISSTNGVPILAARTARFDLLPKRNASPPSSLPDDEFAVIKRVEEAENIGASCWLIDTTLGSRAGMDEMYGPGVINIMDFSTSRSGFTPQTPDA